MVQIVFLLLLLLLVAVVEALKPLLHQQVDQAVAHLIHHLRVQAELAIKVMQEEMVELQAKRPVEGVVLGR
jgi:hypothetical protein